MKTFLRDVLTTLALAAVISLGLRATVQPYIVWQSCMEPNFYEGQQIEVNKVVYKLHEPQRGDVIIFQPPFPSEKPFIKRIIALPGDTVEVKNGAVYINGLKLQESYIKEPPAYTLSQKKIPENEYFVLGDNRNNADDSHTGWTVPRQNIIGKAWLSYWPPDRWGLVSNYHLQEQIDSLANNK